jgi:hypothetical protein
MTSSEVVLTELFSARQCHGSRSKERFYEVILKSSQLVENNGVTYKQVAFGFNCFRYRNSYLHSYTVTYPFVRTSVYWQRSWARELDYSCKKATTSQNCTITDGRDGKEYIHTRRSICLSAVSCFISAEHVLHVWGRSEVGPLRTKARWISEATGNYINIKLHDGACTVPTKGVSTLLWRWGLRDSVTWRVMPAVV